MKPNAIPSGILLFVILVFSIYAQQDDFPVLKGPYLGQESPGMKPEVFAPGIISTERNELNAAFSPGGKSFYFAIRTAKDGYSIWFTCEKENGWTKPRPAPFNSEYSDVDMCFSPDGKLLYFGSTRPIHDGDPPASDFHIWYVEREANGWGPARYLDSPVNSGQRALYPTFAKNGTMYFQGQYPGGFGKADIYRSRRINNSFAKPENLGRVINSDFHEGDVLIAPDESYLIVNTKRPKGFGKGDLFLSFQKDDGSWTPLINMGKPINSSGTDYCPMLSPDGKYFFFTSTRSGNGDIYWVDAQVIEKLRPRWIKQ
jgi:Tol biopolymer transport system component